MKRVVLPTPLGDVAGMSDGRCLSWLGLRYAHATRWEPPKAVKPWSPSVREATSEGPSCPQPPNLESSARQSEDCLYINVFLPAAGLSVNRTLAFIHGGGYTSGSIGRIYDGTFTYDGCGLAAERGLAVVTMQYRLGVLGWMTRRGAIKANLGLRDANTALRFARQLLGPAAARLLLFGQSAGSEMVAAHLASPLLHSVNVVDPPLIHAAALFDGYFVGKDPQTADATADRFLKESPCASHIRCSGVNGACTGTWTAAALDCLHRLSVVDLLAVQSRVLAMEMEEASLTAYRFRGNSSGATALTDAAASSAVAASFSFQVSAARSVNSHQHSCTQFVLPDSRSLTLGLCYIIAAIS